MSATAAQMVANTANAQLSRGPVTDQGKATSCLNRLVHGLAGAFRVLPWETQSEFDALFEAFREEYVPQSATEHILVHKAAQHHWFSSRASRLQEDIMPDNPEAEVDSKRLTLYLRYQATHDRAFQRCIRELRAIKNDRRREQIGFESQKRAEAGKCRLDSQELRQQEEHLRRQEMHETRVRDINTRAQGRAIDNDIRQTIDAPLPGHMRLPFDTLRDAFGLAVHEVNRNLAAAAK